MKEKIDSLKVDSTFKCYNCYKKKICRYCPGRFYLETGNYLDVPKFYCDMADAIIKEFK
jgi:hypothetical protein